MPTMDIFNADAFSMTQLTAAVEKVPYQPMFLGSLAIFEPERVRTEAIAIEKRDGALALIQTSERGQPLGQQAAIKRDIRDFRTSRIAKGDTLYAAEIQNMRAFGADSELQTVQAEVAGRLSRLRADVELTWENMRLRAVQGIVLDADGTTLRNWYSEWGINQAAEIDFALTTDSTDVRKKCLTVTPGRRFASSSADRIESWTTAKPASLPRRC